MEKPLKKSSWKAPGLVNPWAFKFSVAKHLPMAL